MRDTPATNYLVRHWRGNLPLPVSYWLNGSVGSALLIAIITGIGALLSDTASLRFASFVSLLALVLILLFMIWSSVGIWRSANLHPSRGGTATWAVTAKIAVLLGALGSANTFYRNMLPQMREHALLALDMDPLGSIEALISPNGGAMLLHGAFGAGSAEQVRQLLAREPKVNTLVLESIGGRLVEAEKIAGFVRDRRLNTYVETFCESACTYVFLAGHDRAITEDASLGFHRPSFPGVDEREMATAVEEMLRVYRSAGISEDFLQQVKTTPSDSMWYPPPDQLIYHRIVSRVSRGNETYTYRSRDEIELKFRSDKLVASINERFPGSLDGAVNAAWAAWGSGSNDAQIDAAGKRALFQHYGQLFSVVSDELILDYLEISFDQLKAAREISFHTCAMLVNKTLDVSDTLPAELTERERNWVLSILSSTARAVPLADTARDTEMLQPLWEKLRPEFLPVFSEPEKYQETPYFTCEANFDLLRSLRTLPTAYQATAYRILLRPDYQ